MAQLLDRLEKLIRRGLAPQGQGGCRHEFSRHPSREQKTVHHDDTGSWCVRLCTGGAARDGLRAFVLASLHHHGGQGCSSPLPGLLGLRSSVRRVSSSCGASSTVAGAMPSTGWGCGFATPHWDVAPLSDNHGDDPGSYGATITPLSFDLTARTHRRLVVGVGFVVLASARRHPSTSTPRGDGHCRRTCHSASTGFPGPGDCSRAPDSDLRPPPSQDGERAGCWRGRLCPMPHRARRCRASAENLAGELFAFTSNYNLPLAPACPRRARRRARAGAFSRLSWLRAFTGHRLAKECLCAGGRWPRPELYWQTGATPLTDHLAPLRPGSGPLSTRPR